MTWYKAVSVAPRLSIPRKPYARSAELDKRHRFKPHLVELVQFSVRRSVVLHEELKGLTLEQLGKELVGGGRVVNVETAHRQVTLLRCKHPLLAR